MMMNALFIIHIFKASIWRIRTNAFARRWANKFEQVEQQNTNATQSWRGGASEGSRTSGVVQGGEEWRQTYSET